jgi:hypothetical protein
LKVSPIVLPGAVTKSLAVASGFIAVRPAALTKVPALSICSSAAVAAISRARTRIRSGPLTVKGPHLLSTLNTNWKLSSPTVLPTV